MPASLPRQDHACTRCTARDMDHGALRVHLAIAHNVIITRQNCRESLLALPRA